MIYVRRVGPSVEHTRLPQKGLIKLLLMVSALVILAVLNFKALKMNISLQWECLKELPDEEPEDSLRTSILDESTSTSASDVKCGLPWPCLEDDFAFRLTSGAANVIGPKICLDGEILIGGTSNSWGRGINIAVINGTSNFSRTGALIKADSFDMWSDDVKFLIDFLKTIDNGSLVLVASCDDPATRLNNKVRALIRELGSSYISTLGFRDNWVFVGGKGIKKMQPQEKHIKNDKSVNKYGNWPEMVEMNGCIPRNRG